MTDEKTKLSSAVDRAPVISQAIPAMVDATMAVVPPATAAPILSQAPPMGVADVKPVVDKPSLVVAPTLNSKK